MAEKRLHAAWKRIGAPIPSGALEHPAEEQRGKEDGQPRHLRDGEYVSDREDGRREEPAWPEIGAQDAPARAQGAIQRCLEVAAEERLFGEGDDDDLPGDIVEERRPRPENEMRAGVKVELIPHGEDRQGERGEEQRPPYGDQRVPQEPARIRGAGSSMPPSERP